MNKFHTIVGIKSANTSFEDPSAQQIKEDDKEAGHTPVHEVTNNEDEKPAEDAQPGVQKIEAVTLAWGRASMYTILVLYVSLPTLLSKQMPVGRVANLSLFQ